MDVRYSLSIRYEVHTQLNKITGITKKKIVHWFELLQDNPFLDSDFTEDEEDGSLLAVKVIGRYAIFYHLDHAVKEIKVTKLVKAD